MTPETKMDTLKAGTAWAAVGISSWTDLAAALAATYSMLLIAEWFWKRFVRAWAVRRWPQYFPVRYRRRTDYVDTTDRMPLGDE